MEEHNNQQSSIDEGYIPQDYIDQSDCELEEQKHHQTG